MPAFITKVITFTGLAGGTGGAIYATTYYLSGYTLGELLKDKGHELLNYSTEDNSDTADWTNILNAYSKNGAKLKGKAINVFGSAPTKDNIDELKKLCVEATTSRSYSKEDGLLTEQYCVKPVTVKALLNKKGGKKILNWSDEGESNADNFNWDKKIEEYSKLSTTEKISDLNLEPSDQTQQAKRDKFKKWCQNFEGNRTFEKDYHIKYGQFIKWCVL